MGALKNEYLPHYTYEDYCLWEGRWELIEGVPYAMTPAPTGKHQWINLKLLAQFEQQLSGCKNCNASMPMDWKMTDDTVVQPDIFVACFNFKDQKYIETAPVIVVEILSPATRDKDLFVKYELYKTQGVRYYVIIDPENNSWVIHLLEGKEYVKVIHGKSTLYTFDIDSDCKAEIDFSKIF